MANSTPCSVLYELAKSNKVSAHYQLVSEKGPAHQKEFKIHLRIGGNGPFEGIGRSLKEARNNAASAALTEGAPGLHMNPTVELNILSMKSGEMVTYRELDSVSLPQREPFDTFSMTSQYHQNALLHRLPRHPNRSNRLWRISVTICGRAYVGEGRRKSEARGNAASHAMLELKPLLLEKAKIMEIEMAQKQQAAKAGEEKAMNGRASSHVSDLHEIVSRHHLDVEFTTTFESGPAHVRMFHVKCKVGDKEVIGKGVGKKAAKNDAAEKMILILKDLPAPEKKKGYRCYRKEKQKVDNGIDPSLDAITYLTHLLQLRKESMAEFHLKCDNGPQQKGLMRFQIMATVGEFKGIGYGENKKAAKLNAATNLLKSLGIDLDDLRKSKGITEIKTIEDQPLRMVNDGRILNRAPGSPLTSSVNHDFQSHEPQTAKDRLEHFARLKALKIAYNDFVKNKPNAPSEFVSQLHGLTELYTGIGDSIDASREAAAKKAYDAIANKIK